MFKTKNADWLHHAPFMELKLLDEEDRGEK